LFSYSVSVPDFVTSHAQLKAELTPDAGDVPIQEARFYFKLPTTDVLAYIPMQVDKDAWSVVVPAQFIVPGTTAIGAASVVNKDSTLWAFENVSCLGGEWSILCPMY